MIMRMENSLNTGGAARPRVVVVGAGVVGCCIARELARWNVDATVLEAGIDIACGATRANSGIVHAGFDPAPGTLKARYNVRGSRLFPEWARELGFRYQRNQSMVAAFADDELPALRDLLERGTANGVRGLRLVDATEARSLEPNLSPEVRGALVAETGAICDPYDVAFAAAENAYANGVAFRFDEQVVGIERGDAGAGEAFGDARDAAAGGERDGRGAAFLVRTASGGAYPADAVVNAAGVHADDINNLASAHTLHITPVRGDYILYDQTLGSTFRRTVFQVPGASGKGVLVSPTVHGNLFIGPNAVPQESKECLDTTADGLAGVLAKARKTWPGASLRGEITNFAGLRASGDSRDFVIGPAPDAPGFFNAACIDSPGLTSAPAIAQDIARMVAQFIGANENPSFNPVRQRPAHFAEMANDERARAAADDPAWGRIVCRCRKVAEAEVIAALHGPLPVLSIDALKWRCGAMMGVCHGGFCTPDIVRVVCRELGCSPNQLDKRLKGSWMVASARTDYVELAQAEAATNVEPAADSAQPADRARKQASCDVAVIGAGAAGLAAAAAAACEGAHVVVIDKGARPGGILQQCVHAGFGVQRYSEELTGPEYAEREAADLAGLSLRIIKNAQVTGVTRDAGGAFAVDVASPEGYERINAKAVVLATGSRERGFGALNVAGARPSGVYSAGTAQALINLQGCLPGKRAVVLGSGDIGLIMARRMALEGMEVLGVHEIMPYPSGLRRNIVQCLDDFGIPLTLSSTVVRVEGDRRLQAVWVADVDPETRVPIPGTERRIECDTLVLSVGLIPESGLARDLGAKIDAATGGPVVDELFQSTVPGVFCCGNSLHVHDLADFASAEGDAAGLAATRFAASRTAVAQVAADAASDASDCSPAIYTPVRAGEGVRYTVPQQVSSGSRVAIAFRVSAPLERPAFEVVGICGGSEQRLARRRARIAVPAEMMRIDVPVFDAGAFDAIEVRAFDAGRTNALEGGTDW